MSNEEKYYMLPDRHKVVSTTYPANYDGELDDQEEIMSRRVKPQFLIDDDDEYQEQLELKWYKEEHS